jgi:REP element-mobilizing transposase RayT
MGKVKQRQRSERRSQTKRRSSEEQLSFFPPQERAYGGDVRTTRRSRSGRPLSTRQTIHLVLRSTKAKGAFSLRRPQHSKTVRDVLKRFSQKYGVVLLSVANVGNHLHLHVRLTRRHLYAPFIRAVTGAIALKVGGRTRWTNGAATAPSRMMTKMTASAGAAMGTPASIAVAAAKTTAAATEAKALVANATATFALGKTTVAATNETTPTAAATAAMTDSTTEAPVARSTEPATAAATNAATAATTETTPMTATEHTTATNSVTKAANTGSTITGSTATNLTMTRMSDAQTTGQSTNPFIEGQFWDTRPFTRVLSSWTENLRLQDYVKINEWEGESMPRAWAERVYHARRRALMDFERMAKQLRVRVVRI